MRFPRRIPLPAVRLGLAALAFALLAPARAFPPAPFFTLYGTVRDEQGQALQLDGDVVVFYKNGVEVLRQNITEDSQFDQNYQIRIRMDMQRAGTASYSDLANATGTPFTVAVLIHNIPYYPIEMSVARSVGRPGERVRLDLTLGVDSDGDGLPDAWEEAQLFAAGVQPGPNGWDLSLITRDGDFDHDGRSNYEEYVAGTYATDPSDHLDLRIAGKTDFSTHLQFFAIYGKTYTLEASTDLKTWTLVPFYLSSPDPVTVGDNETPPPAPVAQKILSATTTGVTDLYADPASSSKRAYFYRLNVR
ncbi:MAG: hypothetical protein JSS11_11100 [Verrucomicrobia bacterium]|nr:hypothetical protein [Verrucomicrobiota bacterium]